MRMLLPRPAFRLIDFWRLFFLFGACAFSSSAKAENTNDYYAKNNSYRTNCAEYDNVNIPIFSTVVQHSGKSPNFELKATHPSYISAISVFSGCPADFSGSDCQSSQIPPPPPIPVPPAPWVPQTASGITSAYCKKLFDDHINRFEICRTALTWWRNRDMTVRVPAVSETETGSYIKLIKKISDTNSWPEVMVLYQDGNLRFKPHPPKANDLKDVCYGSSIILGPAPENAIRPFIDIEEVIIDPVHLCLDILYSVGGSAHTCLTVDRTEAKIGVSPNYGITTPVVTLRSMWVDDHNADVGRIQSGGVETPVLGSWSQLYSSKFLFYRNMKSIHNPEAPDIAIRLLPPIDLVVQILNEDDNRKRKTR